MISWLNFLLTAANGCELVVEQQAPELSRGLSGGADGGYEVIGKSRTVGAIIWKVAKLGCCVKGGGARIARSGIDTIVGPVTQMCTAGGRCNVSGTREDGTLVDGIGESFNSKIH